MGHAQTTASQPYVHWARGLADSAAHKHPIEIAWARHGSHALPPTVACLGYGHRLPEGRPLHSSCTSLFPAGTPHTCSNGHQP
jgi:hypothetical protein